jgi:DNA repair exonuclease SbcCD ATPase subunit
MRKDKKKYIMDAFNLGTIGRSELEPYLSNGVLDRLDFKQDGLTVCKAAEKIVYAARTERNRIVEEKEAAYKAEFSKISGWDPSSYRKTATSEAKGKVEEVRDKLSNAVSAQNTAKSTAEIRKNLRAKLDGKKLTLIDVNDEKAAITHLEQEGRAMAAVIGEIQAEISALQDRLSKAEDEAAEIGRKITGMHVVIEEDAKCRKDIAELEESLNTLPADTELPDVEALQEELQGALAAVTLAEAHDNMSRIYESTEVLRKEHEKLKKEADAMTALLQTLRVDLPDKILKQAELPFDNLTFDGDDIRINGTYLSNMSTAEQLFAVLQIYHRRNKAAKLKVLFVDRVESLDDRSYETFWKFIHEHGYQAFASKVISAHVTEDVFHVEHGTIKEAL